jgi:hypothetical protein
MQGSDWWCCGGHVDRSGAGFVVPANVKRAEEAPHIRSASENKQQRSRNEGAASIETRR